MRTSSPAGPRGAARDERTSRWWALLCVGLALAGGLACNKKEQEAAALEPSIVQWLDDHHHQLGAVTATGGPPGPGSSPDAGASDGHP
jgi:hypothetical protein